MNVYIWKRVAQATGNYHSEGGVVVFAETEQEARTIANALDDCEIAPQEMPDEVRQCADGEKKIFIMRDAGCC